MRVRPACYPPSLTVARPPIVGRPAAFSFCARVHFKQHPAVSHLQFLLLAVLLDGGRTGRSLRAALEKEGHRRSAPAFYQVMA